MANPIHKRNVDRLDEIVEQIQAWWSDIGDDVEKHIAPYNEEYWARLEGKVEAVILILRDLEDQVDYDTPVD